MNKNIFWHYKATGAGQTIAMDNIFSKNAVGGVFYKTTGGYICTGPMEHTGNGKITFLVWMDDSSTQDVSEGVKHGDPFKLLVYEGNEWIELTFKKVQLAFGGVKTWTEDIFKAKAWNMMIVPDKDWIIKNPVDIVPIVNPDLLENAPEISGKDFYIVPQKSSKITIKNSFRWCEFGGFTTSNFPESWRANRVGKTNDIVISIREQPKVIPSIILKGIPLNSDISEITKEIKISV